MYTWNRPVSNYAIFQWSKAVEEKCPDAVRTLGKLDEVDFSCGWPDYDHTVPDNEQDAFIRRVENI